MSKERVLIVDDDFGTLKLLELILSNNGYECHGFSNARDAMKSFFNSKYSAVISDFYMPDMNGSELLAEIRIKDKFVPFLILTSNQDINTAIELMKNGADDYITKPVVREDILFRVEKTIKANNHRRVIDQIEREKELMSLENKRLADWKTLYASKDTKQSENLIELFNRTLNEGGGLSWLDILKKDMKKSDNGTYVISAELAELIIKTSERHRQFFNNIAYIASINSLNLEVERISYITFVNDITEYITEELMDMAGKYGRTLHVQQASQFLEGELIVCMKFFTKILKELVINAIKYSPDTTPIYIMFEKNTDISKGTFIDIIVKNTPRVMNCRVSDFERQFTHQQDSLEGFMDGKDNVILFNDASRGNDSDVVLFGDDDNLENVTASVSSESYDHVTGIPYEYSELVFDLFYTIEPFPVELDEEEWRGGTGLYIARKIINRHNGIIRNANGIDYSQGSPTPFVKFVISLPYKKIT